MKPVLIVISPYYAEISAHLRAGAEAALKAAGLAYTVVEVPGALEIPGAIAIAHASGKFSAYVALGCVIRGETSHYDIVCNESARGLGLLGSMERAAIGNGILTVENEEQAILRADPAQGNKGGEAVQAALCLAALKANWEVA
jgi:6,7-dimethyl-8-ribityllumazine synthase